MSFIHRPDHKYTRKRCRCGELTSGEARFCYRCSCIQLAALKLIVPAPQVRA
jgi:hypothetical protein